ARHYVEAWAHSRIGLLRLAFRGLISPLKIVHYGQPGVARALGYDPPAETSCAHPAPPALLRPQKAKGTLRCEVAVIGSGAGGACARAGRRGAAKLGLHGQPLRRNARHCKGSGVCAFGCPTDAKRSANVSWVPAAIKAGARLCTGVRVSHLDLHGARRTVHAG